MDYLGRATNIKLTKKINGTHNLTFQMPDKWFDPEIGDFVKNEYVEQLFNEKKVKLYYMDEWFEFYIKSVTDAKNFKSYMKTYTCSDAFIDELSRNGYGITFDEELYNNVEEIGTFTEEILEDSIWYYSPENNWGDFTEYLEEKMFKIPVTTLFPEGVKGYKLHYEIQDLDEISDDNYIKNVFTGEKRIIEMGDDLSRNTYYWDQRGNNSADKRQVLIGEEQIIENDGYIYVFYSDLSFCYKSTDNDPDNDGHVIVITEEVQFYGDKSYALAPTSVDPNKLIQFMAIPPGAEIEVDEAGLILNKDYHYVMTVKQWNDALSNLISGYFYKFESLTETNKKDFYSITSDDFKKIPKAELEIIGNYCAYYDGYLDKIGNLDVLYGKKISITDRTEINITDDIDQYVTVYNNFIDEKIINNDGIEQNKYNFINPDEQWIEKGKINNPNNDYEIDYRICSVTKTRQIVPQLARNLVENAINITSTDGWDVAEKVNSLKASSATIAFEATGDSKTGVLKIAPAHTNDSEIKLTDSNSLILNFGIVGQDYEIQAGKIYCLGIDGDFSTLDKIIIGEGGIISNGSYQITDPRFSVSIEAFSPDGLTGQEQGRYRFIQFKESIKKPYFGIQLSSQDASSRTVRNIYLFEAYTKGIDQFSAYTEINPETNVEIKIVPYYKYSGRELFNSVLDDNSPVPENFSWSKTLLPRATKARVLFEFDVMPGDTYGYQEYFIQQVQASAVDKSVEGETITWIDDTFSQREFLTSEATGKDVLNRDFGYISAKQLPYSASNFTKDDLVISTKYIDLNNCPYYSPTVADGTVYGCDCQFNGEQKYCMYQKYGYCPYLFETEKHCRKIRTLKGEKSNRFNLTQELGKVFDTYPVYWIAHEENGKVKYIQEDSSNNKHMDKRVFYITEKGSENKLGFRYELNLSNISRTIKSDQIVTKLYVQDVDSSISKTGLCTIKTAEDNPSKDSFIIDFSYYISKGILDKDTVERDLYGIEKGDMGYLKQLGYLNDSYDHLSNLIINLSTQSFTELETNLNVNLEAIETSQQQLIKLKAQADKYKKISNDPDKTPEQSQTYENYITKIEEQTGVLNSLIEETFATDGRYDNAIFTAGDNGYSDFLKDITINDIRQNDIVKKHTYEWGILGQYNKQYLQIQEWKKQQGLYLKEINKLSLRFFKKYEPYLKEGTWSDSNYLTDNAYYFGAKEVAAEGAIPKVEYSITVVDLYSLPEYEDYKFDIADTTYIEDIGMFGVNQKTGLPNRLKVLISEISYDLDQPKNNSIKVQNFTTQFEDLFQQVSASVQSLSFNENIYKRSKNFTSNQNVKNESLQGALDTNELTLISTEESNIEIDKNGQSGSSINNHSNQYKLDGQGLFFSNNGGQTWNVGVGPGGINADYIKVGNLDVGKVSLIDNDYLYFMWDKDGIVALRDPMNTIEGTENNLNDYAVFNKYGLTLVEEGKLRLRAGYYGKGDYTTDAELGEVGFYLYDNLGNPILMTESTDNTARLTLQGEILAADSITESNFTNYSLEAGDLAYVLKTEYNTYNIKIETGGIYDYVKSDDESVTLAQWIISNINNGTEGSENFKENFSSTNIVSFSLSSDSDQYCIDNNNKLSYLKTWKLGGSTTKTLVILNNNIYALNTKVTSLIEQNKTNKSFPASSSMEKYKYSTNYYDINGNKQFIDANTHYIKIENELSYYYTKITSASGSTANGSNIGVFINNQASSNGGGPNRVFSCLSIGGEIERKKANNLFTILDDGNLYIGGRMNLGKEVDKIIDIPDSITFDEESKDQSIRIINNVLYVGNENLMQYVTDQIDQVNNRINNLSVPEHTHSYTVPQLKPDAIPVTVENGFIKYNGEFTEVNLITNIGYSDGDNEIQKTTGGVN